MYSVKLLATGFASAQSLGAMSCSFHGACDQAEMAVPMLIILAVLVRLVYLFYLWTRRAGSAECARVDGVGAGMGEDASSSPPSENPSASPSNTVVATPRPMRRLLATHSSPDLSGLQACWECMSPFPTTPPCKRRRKVMKVAGGSAAQLPQDLNDGLVADFDCVPWTPCSARSWSISQKTCSRRSHRSEISECSPAAPDGAASVKSGEKP